MELENVINALEGFKANDGAFNWISSNFYVKDNNKEEEKKE
jgi:hypothetical protein